MNITPNQKQETENQNDEEEQEENITRDPVAEIKNFKMLEKEMTAYLEEHDAIDIIRKAEMWYMGLGKAILRMLEVIISYPCTYAQYIDFLIDSDAPLNPIERYIICRFMDPGLTCRITKDLSKDVLIAGYNILKPEAKYIPPFEARNMNDIEKLTTDPVLYISAGKFASSSEDSADSVLRSSSSSDTKSEPAKPSSNADVGWLEITALKLETSNLKESGFKLCFVINVDEEVGNVADLIASTIGCKRTVNLYLSSKENKSLKRNKTFRDHNFSGGQLNNPKAIKIFYS